MYLQNYIKNGTCIVLFVPDAFALVAVGAAMILFMINNNPKNELFSVLEYLAKPLEHGEKSISKYCCIFAPEKISKE